MNMHILPSLFYSINGHKAKAQALFFYIIISLRAQGSPTVTPTLKEGNRSVLPLKSMAQSFK